MPQQCFGAQQVGAQGGWRQGLVQAVQGGHYLLQRSLKHPPVALWRPMSGQAFLAGTRTVSLPLSAGISRRSIDVSVGKFWRSTKEQQLPGRYVYNQN